MERALRGKEPAAMSGAQGVLPKRCPRCESTDTKFCYFNNYSQSQPRHFCRACRRYWTEGGTLRNVPQGGGSHRKAKRPKTSQVAPHAKGSVAPSAVDPLPQPSSFLIRGGSGGEVGMPRSLNFQTFYPAGSSGTSMMADFTGLQACYDQACFNPTVPMLPAGFLNMPNYQQILPLPLPPRFDPIDPSLVIASHQQMNSTVFTSTTTMTTAVATTTTAVSSVMAAGVNNGGGDPGFWNNNELNIHSEEGSSPPAPNPSGSN